MTALADHAITMTKGPMRRAMSPGQVPQQAQMLLAKIITPGRLQRGWSFEWDGTHELARTAGREQTYSLVIRAKCAPSAPRAGIDTEFANVVSVLVGASRNFPGWQVAAIDGKPYTESVAVAAGSGGRGESDYVGYAPFIVPGNWATWFTHLYERDAQISLMMSKLEAAAVSDWNKRFNAILAGPPACGKTEIASTVYRMCGEHGGVWRIDGTAITQAGFLKMLDEAEELPRVIVWEEIEKTTEDVLRPLLGLLDTRGEIRKTTARKSIIRDARIICIATVNDYDKFKGMLSGALASRFGMPIFCQRPNRSLLARILKRELADINGDERWIKPCLDYLEEIESSDPRIAIDICLSGRDEWLTGEYAQKLREVRKHGS